MNTEDKFYASKHGQPEKFAGARLAGHPQKNKILKVLHDFACDTDAKGIIAYSQADVSKIKDALKKNGISPMVDVAVADDYQSGTHYSRPGVKAKFQNVFLGGVESNLRMIELYIKQMRQALSRNDAAEAKEIGLALQQKATLTLTHLKAFMPHASKNLSGKTEKFGLEDACWEGYEAVGTKQQDGRTVPNCVPMSKETHAADDRSADFLRKMAVGITPSNIRQMQIVVSQALAYGQGKRDTMLIEEAKAAQSEINELKKAGH